MGKKEMSQEMASKVTELVQGGMPLTDALEKVLSESASNPSTRVQMTGEQRVDWIRGLGNIADLKKATKIAYAKKSKSQGKPAEARYEDEIAAGKARLNELIADINTSPDPILRAIELGEEDSGVVQRILDTLEEGIEDKIKEVREARGISAKTAKEQINSTPKMTPNSIQTKVSAIGAKYLASYEGRTATDQRVIYLNKKVNWLEKTEATVEPIAKVAEVPMEATEKKAPKKTEKAASGK